MRVNELIDILRDQQPDAEVELAVVAPVDDDEDDITVDRYIIEGVLPWVDAEEVEEAAEPQGTDEAITIWLVGGEDKDVDAFLDAIEQSVDDQDAEPDVDREPEH